MGYATPCVLVSIRSRETFATFADLAARELIVSGDSLVIDTAASWVNLLAYAVQTRLPESRVIDLGVAAESA